MSRLPEIISLFARLASNLETLDPMAKNEFQFDDLAILNLNQSLNLTERSRVRVLDTTLSLMCFTAPQVFDSVIQYLVNTIVSVLASSIHCNILRVGKEEVLRIGGSISSHDCMEVIEACADVLGKLKGHGKLFRSLSYAVVRVAALASSFRYAFQLTLILNVKPFYERNPAISKLLCHFQQEISLKTQEVPLRLLLWYLDPMILKHDVSDFLKDAVKRPFLCLNMEFYERMEWRSKVVCLVISPAMFIETRALLHNWFLATGLASVLKLQIELTSLVLDVVSRPMWWGILSDVGSKLPFSHAYFPYKHQLLRIFAGSLSCESFLHLVHSINQSVSHAGKYSDPTFNHAAIKIAIIDYKSAWAMAMNFPEWFYFACVLLFFGKSFQHSFHFKCTSGAAENEQSHDEEPSCSAAAAKYIAWIVNPITESHQDLLADCLTKISGLLTLKQFASDDHNEASSGKRKLKKPKFLDKADDTSVKEYDCQRVRLWLKEFQHMYISNRTVNSSATYEAKTSHGACLEHNMLFRRISLGILIGCSDYIDENGCEMLLHYAATGAIFESQETRDGPFTSSAEYNRKDSVAGACLVFHLTDVSESMSASMFETEERGIEFVCRVKLRAAKYLLKCVDRLLQLKSNQDDGLVMLKDLYNRLVRWKHQGQDVFQGYKDLDDAIHALSNELSRGDFI